MTRIGIVHAAAVSLLAVTFVAADATFAQRLPLLPLPASRTIEVRDPVELPSFPVPQLPVPPTVANPQHDLPSASLSLDEAICIALENSQVVRRLAGTFAVSSGQTIYDTAIVNNTVAREQAAFDPNLGIEQLWNRFESPGVVGGPRIDGPSRDDYRFDLGLAKPTVTGGEVRLGVNAVPERNDPPGILDPQTSSSLGLSARQPLLQGGGMRANRAPIVLARIDTERSYFQFKDSVQELVRGVVEAYWNLVAARTEVWARQEQVEQADFAYRLTKARFDFNMANSGELAQTRVSLNNFLSARLSARNAVLDREAALRNILGLPPCDGVQLVPSTPPTTERNAFGWESLMQLAETYRPDVIELKLILEADEQRLLLSRNRALPRVDAQALYRWNGLEGELPGGDRLASRPGQFTDWSLGVNFSVPLGLRAERAALRSDELVISRDRALLDQQLHAVTHVLAQRLRNVEVFYEQYELTRETREAARTNVNLQIENYRTGRTQFINALLAINDWGDAIQNEARFLAAYNVELTNIERETGTILESHGVRFYEELQCALGPLGRMGHGRRFTATLQPTPNAPRYPAGDQPAENFFNLENPIDRFQSPSEGDAGLLPPLTGGETELLPSPEPPRRIP